MMGSRHTKLRMSNMVYSLHTRDTKLWSIIKPSKKEVKMKGPHFENSGMDTFYEVYRIPEHVDEYTHIHTHTPLIEELVQRI